MDKDQIIYAEAQIAATLSLALTQDQGVMTPQRVIAAYADMVQYMRRQGVDLINVPIRLAQAEQP